MISCVTDLRNVVDESGDIARFTNVDHVQCATRFTVPDREQIVAVICHDNIATIASWFAVDIPFSRIDLEWKKKFFSEFDCESIHSSRTSRDDSSDRLSDYKGKCVEVRIFDERVVSDATRTVDAENYDELLVAPPRVWVGSWKENTRQSIGGIDEWCISAYRTDYWQECTIGRADEKDEKIRCWLLFDLNRE